MTDNAMITNEIHLSGEADKLWKHAVRNVSKIIEVDKNTEITTLEKIRIGHLLRSRDGREGIVDDIEICVRNNETQYYFRLAKKAGTILIIR